MTFNKNVYKVFKGCQFSNTQYLIIFFQDTKGVKEDKKKTILINACKDALAVEVKKWHDILILRKK